MEGVTTTLAVPGSLGVPPSGGLIWGGAALIDLDGATIDAMQIKSPAAMVANLSESSKDAGGGARWAGAPEAPPRMEESQRGESGRGCQRARPRVERSTASAGSAA